MTFTIIARPEITWRDAQHILVQTAVPFNLNDPSWIKTASGRPYSHTFGYGRVDGYSMVQLAKKIKLVGPPVQIATDTIDVDMEIPEEFQGIISPVEITPDDLDKHKFKHLEQVTVTVNIRHQRRGDVVIELESPNGIISVLSPGRKYDDSRKGFANWVFMSVAHW